MHSDPPPFRKICVLATPAMAQILRNGGGPVIEALGCKKEFETWNVLIHLLPIRCFGQLY